MSFYKDLAGNLGGKYIAPDYFATDYQKRTPQREAEKRQQSQGRQQNRSQEAQQLLTTGNPTGTILSGTEAEQQGQLAGLNLGAIAYGQGLGKTGDKVQDLLKRVEGRASQSAADPATSALMSQKQSAQARARRELAGTNARGTAMAGAIDAVGRQKDQEIAASLYGQSRMDDSQLRSILGNIISGTTSVMQGEKAANISQPAIPEQQKGFLENLLPFLYS